MLLSMNNADPKVVADFGNEWKKFDQSTLSQSEQVEIFNNYFSIFPWKTLDSLQTRGADIGCGSGRWATLAAQKTGQLELVDASHQALEVARKNLAHYKNVRFHHASVGALPFENESLDFAYSLGVLHHVPDTEAAVQEIARTLKPGAPLLLYLYYRFDNRPAFFHWLWSLSQKLRIFISHRPPAMKEFLCDLIAFFVYWPLARFAKFTDKLGFSLPSFPLYEYRNRSFYVMRTDALDRFGTKLEKRFTKNEIEKVFLSAGFDHIKFSDLAPYWCAIGFKKTR